MYKEESEELLELAYNTIILYLRDKVLRDISTEKNASGMWLELEQLYMSKILTNRMYLKGILFGFRMIEDKCSEDWLDEFAKKSYILKMLE